MTARFKLVTILRQNEDDTTRLQSDALDRVSYARGQKERNKWKACGEISPQEAATASRVVFNYFSCNS